jgi:hypothetical protein
MKRSVFLSACLVTTTSLWAQGTLVSPPALTTVEGGNRAYAFLYYSNARHQHAEGELRGKALSLTEVAWRLDYSNHTTGTSQGRTWSKVTLSLADTDWTQMTRTYTKNQLSTPVEVFNSALTIPPASGTPLFKPDNFGGSGFLAGKFKIPFTSPYSYSGSRDLLLDWMFLGGKMANGATWTTSRSYQYYLDGHVPMTTYTSPRPYYPAKEPNPRCRDSAIVGNWSAHTYATLVVHGITHSNLSYRDNAQFSMYSRYTAPNARIITAIAFAGVPAGVNIGAHCNLLYANLNLPWLALGRLADRNGHSATWTSPLVPWTPGMANVPIWVQTAWEDSKLKVFSLTRAMRVVMPADKPRPRRLVVLYHYDPTRTTGNGPYLNSSAYAWMPITRYTHK